MGLNSERESYLYNVLDKDIGSLTDEDFLLMLKLAIPLRTHRTPPLPG